MTHESSTLIEERLRIYLIDRLCAPILHNMRNALQGIMGHAALLRLPLGDRLDATDLSKKLQTAAEQCNSRIEALNAVLSLTRHRGLTSRLPVFLQTIEPLLHDVVKGQHNLRLQLDSALDRSRVVQQPLAQLLLLLCVCTTETGDKGRSLLIEITEPPHQGLKKEGEGAAAAQPAVILVRLRDSQTHWSPDCVSLLVTAADNPPSDPLLYPYWLTGWLLRQVQTQAEVVTTEAGIAVQTRWPVDGRGTSPHK